VSWVGRLLLTAAADRALPAVHTVKQVLTFTASCSMLTADRRPVSVFSDYINTKGKVEVISEIIHSCGYENKEDK